MSLLKWQELAKRKSELGNKINYVHDTIMKHDITQNTSNESLSKVFKPVTTKLDDIIDSNLALRMPKRKKRPPKKNEEPGIDYAPEVDPFEDMEVNDLFGDHVPPQREKQLVPKPPTYEESLKDILEGNKQIYVDPQYLNLKPDDELPEYDEESEDYGEDYEEPEDYGADYGEDEEPESYDDDYILNDAGITTYTDVEARLNEPEMTKKKKKIYLGKIVKDATQRRNELKGHRMQVSKEYNKGNLSETEKQMKMDRIKNAIDVLNDYIIHCKEKMKGTKKGTKKGKGVVFFNNPKQLLKKLELIIGEISAGNTSVKMRNTGVAILDMLLKAAEINRPQHRILYDKYFKI